MIVFLFFLKDRFYILTHRGYSTINAALVQIDGFLWLMIHIKLDYIHMCIPFPLRFNTSIYESSCSELLTRSLVFNNTLCILQTWSCTTHHWRLKHFSAFSSNQGMPPPQIHSWQLRHSWLNHTSLLPLPVQETQDAQTEEMLIKMVSDN